VATHRQYCWISLIPLAFIYWLVCHKGLEARYEALSNPSHAPGYAIRADMATEILRLNTIDSAAAQFAREGIIDLYEVNTLDIQSNSMQFPGTPEIVINTARLKTTDARALALSHELFHAAHHFSLLDLFVTEEFLAHWHTSRIAASYNIPLPANNITDLIFQFLPTLFPAVLIGNIVASLYQYLARLYRRFA